MRRKMISPLLLEEYLSSGFEEMNNPFISKSSRFWGKYSSIFSSLVSLLLLALSYAVSYQSDTLSNFFLIIVYFFVGTPALLDTLNDLKTFTINIDVLMTLAAFLSVAIGSQLEGALLLVLFALSHSLENMVTQKTKGALSALQKISPTLAIVIESSGETFQKSVREIAPGTHILIRSGEIIPLDGKVISGASFVNLSHLTGESLPLLKKEGDQVQAGSLNTDGTLTIEVLKTSGESTLAKMITLITKAHEAKPKLEKFLDRFGSIYAKTIILTSFAIALLLPFIFSIPFFTNHGSIYRSLAFLIAASPCALIIGAPTAYLGAISACAKKGILLKGGVILDALTSCTRLFIDKTGTLTTGQLRCSLIEVVTTSFSKQVLERIAASLENGVHHPIAEAILRHAKEHSLELFPVEDLKAIPGYGVEGVITLNNKKERVYVGSVEFILQKIPVEKRQGIEEKVDRNGKVVSLVLVKEDVGIFHFTDELRPNIKTTVENLLKVIDVEMLTGDHKSNGETVAKLVGLKKIHTDVTPEQKLTLIKEYSKNENIIMVGDGINDAPALSFAYVGIAMGQIGSKTAVEAADVVLLTDSISSIEWLLKQSKKTHRIVKQNITLALLAIFLNALLSLSGVIPLFVAVILHEGSTVIVGLNSLRLLKKDPL
jgi:Cd2+/Zn2+-exporting ATPase